MNADSTLDEIAATVGCSICVECECLIAEDDPEWASYIGRRVGLCVRCDFRRNRRDDREARRAFRIVGGGWGGNRPRMVGKRRFA